MARCIDKIKLILLPKVIGVVQANCLGFDCDSTLPFQIHGVKPLVYLVPLINCARQFHKAVGKSGLSMIYVSDNAEITDMFWFHVTIVAQQYYR